MNEMPFELELPIFAADLATMQLPDPDLLQYYQHLQDRVLWLDDEISWEEIKKYVKQILIWNKEDKGKPVEERIPIKVFVNSPGGDVFSALSLYHTMVASQTKIITVNFGDAASMGSILFLGGSERYAMQNSIYMIHCGSMVLSGTSDQVQQTSKAMEKLNLIVKKIYLGRTGIEEKVYNRNKSKEWYIFGEEQMELGIAHKMVNSLEEII